MGDPATLDEVRQHRRIAGTSKGLPLVWEVQEHGVEMRYTPPATHPLTDGEAMVDSAVDGLGMGQLAISQVREHPDAGRLITVLTSYASAGVDIHAVWPKRVQLSPRVRYLVDELVEYASQGRFN